MRQRERERGKNSCTCIVTFRTGCHAAPVEMDISYIHISCTIDCSAHYPDGTVRRARSVKLVKWVRGRTITVHLTTDTAAK